MKTGKRILSIFLVALMLLTAAPLAGFVGLEIAPKAKALDANGQCGNNVSQNFNSSTGALTISGTGAMWDWDSFSPFCRSSEIKSVTINSGVTSIGNYAFKSCTSLTSVKISDSVTRIRQDAFNGCTSLTSVTIPDSMKSIGDRAFEDCSSLTNVTIPESVTSIGTSVFYGCTLLQTIAVSEDNSYFSSDSYGVLYNKYKSTLIQYPVGNERIAYTIPDSVTRISDDAFLRCISLTSVTISDSVTSIGILAFAYCTSLTSVTIPESVTSIGYYAFTNCTSLSSVAIGNGLTSIGYGAFEKCTSLTSMTIPDSVTSIGGSAFSGCTSLTSVTIGDGLTSIDEGRTGFVVDDVAFRVCTSLQTIAVSEDNSYFSSDSYGVLYNKDKSTLIQYPVGNERITYTIPDSVTRIRECAFSRCTSLTSVTIGNSVTSINRDTFEGCTSLASVTIPASVTSIGYYAFWYCTSLKDVYYAGTEEQWKMIGIDSGNECLTNATIHFNSSGEEPNIEVLVEDIRMEDSFKRVGIGTETQLSATVVPEDATIKDIAWTSDNPSVAIVDKNGLVTAVGEGLATITATTVQGGYPSECVFNVYDTTIDEEMYHKSSFDPRGVDNNSFINGNKQSNMGFWGCKNYFINDAWLTNQLLNVIPGINSRDRVMLLTQMFLGWGGACYGIETVAAMMYEGILSARDLGMESGSFFEMSPFLKPIANQKLLDMIHFYHLLQFSSTYGADSARANFTFFKSFGRLEYVASKLGAYYGNSYSNKAFWQKMLSDAEKELLLFYSPSHALLVTGVSEDAYGNPQLLVFDCNNLYFDSTHQEWSPLNFITIKKDGNAYYTKCESKDIKINDVDTKTIKKHVTTNVVDEFDVLAYMKISDIPRLDKSLFSSSKKLSTAKQARDDSHIKVSFSLQDRFKLYNAEGQYIHMNGNDVDATMNIYDIRVICRDTNPLLILELDRTDSLTFESNEATEIYVNEDELLRAESEGGFQSVTIDLDESISVNNPVGTFSITVDKGNSNDDMEVLKISGNSQGTVSVSKKEDESFFVSSDTVIHNAQVESITDIQEKPLDIPQEIDVTKFTIQKNDVICNINEDYIEHTHTYTAAITTEPTCTADGEATYTCSVCGDTYTEPIPATGNHADDNNDGKCDTCGEKMTGGKHCKYCGKIHGGAFGWLVKFFHSILAIFKR